MQAFGQFVFTKTKAKISLFIIFTPFLVSFDYFASHQLQVPNATFMSI